MFKETTFSVPGPAGRLDVRATAQSLVPIVGIFCHPHPQQEGSMQNKVVTTAIKAWFGLGVSTVRFDFRGIGESEGEYGDGTGEQADLEAIIDWAKTKYPGYALWLGGFSFGSGIAFQVAKRVDAEHLLMIAPPVHHMDFEGASRIPPKTDCALIVAGQDEVVPLDLIKAWYGKCCLQRPMHFWNIPDAGHFFHGKLPELRDLVVAACPLIQQNE